MLILKSRTLLCIAGFFIIITDSGILGSHGGLFYSLFVSIFLPAISPFLLIQIALTQDSPGFSGYDWYIAFIFVSFVMTINFLIRFNFKSLLKNRDLVLIMFIAIFAILYALIVSYINVFFDGMPQSSTRPPYIVGILMLIMLVSGVVSGSYLYSFSNKDKLISQFVLLLLSHNFLIALIQILFDPSLFASQNAISQLTGYAQLVNPTAFGFPRITGLYLTPNGFALSSILVYLVYFIYSSDFDLKSIFSFFTISLLVTIVFFSFSKALMSYLFIMALIFFLIARPKYRFILGLLAIIILISCLTVCNLEEINKSFRISEGLSSDSYRHQAWALTLKEFDTLKWIFGTGLSYWPIFFESHLGFSLSDPHSYLLSIPGTFGIIGVIFYFILIVILVKNLINQTTLRKKLAIWALLSLIIVKDAVSIPYLFGNTPLTYLIWLIVFGVLKNNTEQSRSWNRTQCSIISN